MHRLKLRLLHCAPSIRWCGVGGGGVGGGLGGGGGGGVGCVGGLPGCCFFRCWW